MMTKLKQQAVLSLGICILGLCGCTSIKSSFPYRSVQGKFTASCMPTAEKGVPCKIRVPVGLRVSVEETLLVDPANAALKVPKDKRIYKVKTTEVTEDQVFLVHIPRPIAGELTIGKDKDTGYVFDANGNLTAIGAEITDTTLADVAGALGSDSLGGAIKSFKKTSTLPSDKGMVEITRTVAIKEFSYSDCSWIDSMNEWVHSVIGECTTPCLGECITSSRP